MTGGGLGGVKSGIGGVGMNMDTDGGGDNAIVFISLLFSFVSSLVVGLLLTWLLGCCLSDSDCC